MPKALGPSPQPSTSTPRGPQVMTAGPIEPTPPSSQAPSSSLIVESSSLGDINLQRQIQIRTTTDKRPRFFRRATSTCLIFPLAAEKKLPQFKGGKLVTTRSFRIGSTISTWWLVYGRKAWRSTYPSTLFASESTVSIKAPGEAPSPSFDHLQASVPEIYHSDSSGDRA